MPQTLQTATTEFRHLAEFKFAEDGQKAGHFTGYGAIFGNVDSHGDVIERGAFKETLREWEAEGKLPKMLLQHGGFLGQASDGLPIGKWTSMEENSKGLKVEGFLDPLDTDEGKKIYAGLKNNTLDGLSIGYRVRKDGHVYGTKPGEARRTLKAVDLLEVSIVTFPSNPKSRVGSVKSFFQSLTSEETREIEAILRRKDLSAADAKRAISGFKEWLQRDAVDPGANHREDGEALQSLLDGLKKAREGLI